MKELFFMGGPLFMTILSLLLIAMLVWMIVQMANPGHDKEKALRKINYGKNMGLFAMITGIFGQLLGLYGALSAIEKAHDIAPGIIFAGFKISMISTLYGIIIYLIALIFWFAGSLMVEKRFK